MSAYFREGVFLPTRARRAKPEEVRAMEAEMELTLLDRELDAIAGRWGLIEVEQR